MVVFAVLVVLQSGDHADKGIWQQVAQVCVIVLGVLIGLFLRPDFSRTIENAVRAVRVDNLAAPDLIRRLSDDEVTSLVTEIIEARSTRELAELATRHGWKPIIDAGAGGAHPSLFRWDFKYDVILTPRPGNPELYNVSIELDTKRRLPQGRLWVSVARNLGALRSEFAEEGCLNRELIRVDDESWEAATKDRSFAACVTVGKEKTKKKDAEIDKVSEDLLRIYFPTIDIPEGPVRVQVDQGGILSRSVTDFPVKLTGYFCAGESRLGLRINDGDVHHLDAYANFAGDTELDVKSEGVAISVDEPRITVSTSGSTVLWPGSGVVFVWQHND